MPLQFYHSLISNPLVYVDLEICQLMVYEEENLLLFTLPRLIFQSVLDSDEIVLEWINSLSDVSQNLLVFL